MSDSDLVLTPPAPVAAVPVEKAATMLPVPEERAGELTAKARDFADVLAALDPRSPEFGRKVRDITAMGDTEIRAASQVANRMLKRPVAALKAARGEGPTRSRRWPTGWWSCGARSWTWTPSRRRAAPASCSA
ncbi:hypothetical protein [Thermocatellispora tengchongensis]|uniref:hypothetical protein n=1 Tax=Thermocatellispora tengchongensis TaxID=1073253 RepID=UPI00362D32C4